MSSVRTVSSYLHRLWRWNRERERVLKRRQPEVRIQQKLNFTSHEHLVWRGSEMFMLLEMQYSPVMCCNPLSSFSLCPCYSVHLVEQKSIGVKFSKSRTGSHVTYSCHHNSSLLLSPYLRIRGVSLSSIHYNQSHHIYINRRQQYTCLIWN